MCNEPDEPLYYCTDCISLDIRYDDDGILYCHHCGADAKSLDIAPDVWAWSRLYARKYKKSPLPYSTPYDDLKEIYDEETVEVENEANAYASGLTVMDVMQRNLNKLDRI